MTQNFELLYLSYPESNRKAMQRKKYLFERTTGIKLIDPFENAYEELSNGTISGMQILDRDLSKIENADGLIAHLKKADFDPRMPTIGTSMEIFYNSRTLKKPTFIITDINHPFFYSLGAVYPSWDIFFHVFNTKIQNG